MTELAPVVFWACACVCAFAYLGYPASLAVLGAVRRKRVRKDRACRPSVSVVIAARNEGRRILARIDDLRAQSYPAELLEVIVVSDGSTDDTVEQARAAQRGDGAGVHVVDRVLAQGKAAALAAAAREAQGDVLVFADARQEFHRDAIAHLAANFADSEVGAVSGELLFRSSADSVALPMGLYWKYEKWIRKAESRTGSVVGATGAIYAVRRRLYRGLPEGVLLDDVMTPLQVALEGYRVVFDPDAIAYDTPSQDVGHEWRRKVRTLAGNWQLLTLEPGLLVPWRNRLWFRLLSHKFSRLLVPFALPLLLACSGLAGGPAYRFFFALQIALYALALAAGWSNRLRRCRIAALCHFFVVLNAAALVGFWH
ncbi:MAG: glycosyltransferase family 2 protein, partial [Deltaproteobacteria bacterium]|nr:glycosyltransferase family 2 protein [Deltaproteobacteria bacterium]